MNALTRVFALAGAVFCLALQPPLESSMGHAPVPPVVGMKGEAPIVPPTESHGPMELELWKYALTQGGLTIVVLVTFFYARRDYTKRATEDRNDKQLLVELVEKNTAALTSQKESTDRVARALEVLELKR